MQFSDHTAMWQKVHESVDTVVSESESSSATYTEETETSTEKTDGDIFELVPATPYTDDDLDYNDEESIVVYEHEYPEDRNIELVESTVENWDEYDTVLIGYAVLFFFAF